MTFSKPDILYLRWSLLTFFLVLGAGNILIVASKNYTEKARHDQQEARRQLSEARARLATAEADRENMRDYMLEYNALMKRSVIGSGQRLDWVEGLNKIHQQDMELGSIDFTYSILPQKNYAPSPALDSGNFELNRSDMSLHFDLLHEGQLMSFFDRVRSGISGWYILDKCSLERSTAAPEGDDFGVPEHLKAECAGGWVTLRDKREAK